MPNSDRPELEQTDQLLAHDELRAQIPGFVSDLVLRTAPPVAYRQLSEHLRVCAACRAEVAELSALLREAVAGELNPPPSYPPPRLTFLHTAPAPPWLRDALGRLTVSFSQPLLDQIRLPPARGTVRSAERRTAPSPLYQYEQSKFEPADAQPVTPLTISVFGLGTEPGTVDVVVRVGVAGKGVDLAGSEVILTMGQVERQERTDKFGYVYFRGLSAELLPNLQIAIVPRP